MAKNYRLTWIAAMVIAVLPMQMKAQGVIPMPTVNADSLMKHVVELSSEAYEGRLAGSNGYDAAARYAERTLRRYGVQPLKKGYRQGFEVECNEVENCKFNVYYPGSKDRRYFTLGNEFCCAGMTGRGYTDAEMVFVGYGIDDGAYNEFANVDVQGKLVVALTGLPESSNLPLTTQELYFSLRDKARTAEKHGAVGLIAININPGCPPYEPQGRIYCGRLPHLTTYPMLHLTFDTGRELFAAEGHDLDTTIARINRLHQPQSFPFKRRAEIDVNAKYNANARTSNVVGIMPGIDPRLSKEIIVVGASLDHVGMQGETCLFPGADINASGVAAVLETARVLSEPYYRPKRSIVFVLFSGSEQQYLGSRKFIEQFPDVKHIEAFVNAQNIGSGDSIVVLGDNHYPNLIGIVANHDTLASRRNILHTDEKTDPRGDARVFDALEIPSVVITTHNGMNHNRVPSDIWENVDRRMLNNCAQLMAETVAELGEGLYQGRSRYSKIHLQRLLY